MTSFYIAVGTRHINLSEATLGSVHIRLTKADKQTQRWTPDVLKVMYMFVHGQKYSAHAVGEQIVKAPHGQISKSSVSTAEARFSKHFLGL